jgi:polyribonucleotide nucleotidyltransferase
MDPTNEDTLLAAKKDSARWSLENLLRKQRRDLQETETLIRDLADNSNNSTKLTALTKSILSGFDYGFVSRSEGCRVEKVEDHLKVGQIVPVRVKEVDPQGKISLTMKNVEKK